MKAERPFPLGLEGVVGRGGLSGVKPKAKPPGKKSGQCSPRLLHATRGVLS